MKHTTTMAVTTTRTVVTEVRCDDCGCLLSLYREAADESAGAKRFRKNNYVELDIDPGDPDATHRRQLCRPCFDKRVLNDITEHLKHNPYCGSYTISGEQGEIPADYDQSADPKTYANLKARKEAERAAYLDAMCTESLREEEAMMDRFAEAADRQENLEPQQD